MENSKKPTEAAVASGNPSEHSKKKRKRNKKQNTPQNQVTKAETPDNLLENNIIKNTNSPSPNSNSPRSVEGVVSGSDKKSNINTANAKPAPNPNEPTSSKKVKGDGGSKPPTMANHAPKCPPVANKSPLFQWSRKENNMNLAVEENHNNLVLETNSMNSDTSRPLDAVNQNYDEVDNVKVTSVTVQSLANDLMPQGKRETDKEVPQQKTKAQLKAERRAAFEAEKAAQIAAQKEEKLQKSKADLRAERRAVQEAQRAQKTTGTGDKPDSVKGIAKPNENKTTNIESQKNINIKKPTVKMVLPVKDQTSPLKGPSPDKKSKGLQRKLRLFSHLPQHVFSPELTASLGMASVELHPAVIKAGLQMAQGLVTGSNARCVASLAALKEVIKDYSTPPQKELSRELDATITQHVGFLKKCRPLAASTSNAVKRLKFEVTQIDSTFNDAKAKNKLNQLIDTFIHEEIILAKRGISQIAGKKITDNDVILTYACSSLVKQVLSDAHANGKKFRVVVVDSRPGLEGCEMLRYLVSKGICCTYVWINAVSYVIKEVTKVILGCHSLQANGYVMSRVGSSQVALVAHSNNVPVLVCCETYKFCERVHTDSFICNELGDPDKFVTTTPVHKAHLGKWKDINSLNVVSLTYDVMPAHLVTCVITELEMLPCTSVPVVLRVKQVATHEMYNDKFRVAYG